MKSSLFIVANVWLMTALALFVGRTPVRHDPAMYAFLSAGAWLYPDTYNRLVGVCVVAAVVCLALWIRESRRSSGSPA